jgi:hypothetical protein
MWYYEKTRGLGCIPLVAPCPPKSLSGMNPKKEPVTPMLGRVLLCQYCTFSERLSIPSDAILAILRQNPSHPSQLISPIHPEVPGTLAS